MPSYKHTLKCAGVEVVMGVFSAVGILGVVSFRKNEKANVIGQQKFKSHLQYKVTLVYTVKDPSL